jgi:beta-lactamase class C
MTKFKHISFFFIALSVITLNIPAQAHYQMDPSIDILVNNTIKPWLEKNNIPGAVVEVYAHGKSHSYQYGYANLGQKKLMTQRTIFEIGSFTKLFTALLLAEYVDTGKLDLSQSITHYVPTLANQKYFKDISLLMLATFSSGLPLYTPETVKTPAQIQDYLLQYKPQTPLGSSWIYSNISIGLLGWAIEAVSNKNINALYRKEILKPLHMQALGLEVPKYLKSQYAQGYDDKGIATPPLEISAFPAAGSMKASGHDMLQFLKAALNVDQNPADIEKAMRVTQTAYTATPLFLQGLVWNIYPLSQYSKAQLLNPAQEMNLGPIPSKSLTKTVYDGNALIDKTGATHGFRSYIAVIPNKQEGIVIMVNRYVNNGEIVKAGREILLNLN